MRQALYSKAVAFINEPTKDTLSDVLHITVYIGFGFFIIGKSPGIRLQLVSPT